ncbi:hypothetical protein [Capnocytophaga sp. oral taxon 864]|uniref:hypothetical protein n=1 Tax=Capnocytophaga sp. oral taxon 864 TaxID=1316593 RepID=UPI000D027C67|nr:hypothetical protein [Capnocytophaga sp. oral taxon 864]AVM55891.1 hypothetical protein C3V44_09905 [Capnocytophaga sp. oral taxon 864]
MKETELPQEKGALQDFTELCYVTDDEGNYTTLSSWGWEVKSIALEASLSRLQEQIDEAKADVLAGHKSPIVYYMLLNRMDWAVLTDAMHRWQWVIKRHAKPSVFKKLSSKTLQKYAEVFGITVEELCELNK